MNQEIATTAPDEMLQNLIDAAVAVDKLPPVNDWQPDKTYRIRIRIDRECRWFYQDSEIRRPAMVKLFSSILRQDDDGYCLVTPTERLLIQVDYLPLLAKSLNKDNKSLVFTLNTGESVTVSVAHPLRWLGIKGGQLPAIYVRDRLDALIHRNVFYQLADMAEEIQEQSERRWVVFSDGQPFPLGSSSELNQ